ncbi:cadherin-like domain-containing protein [Novosphingobium sp.]|uniref:Ig-like domain-containing protein n=1 Tax=Novosphingobium sp. TaxID=1874826 RepID=UPI0025F80047|nr:cadherin-like domain-containing protein [Novosphingobium sp.]
MPDEFCPRQIIFTIPGNPGVTVTATESGGAIVFEVVANGTTNKIPDLRGLFFDLDEGKMAGLTITGDLAVSGSRIQANGVLDLGHGANMTGKTRDGFDVGVEFGSAGRGRDAVGDSTFTLSNSAGDLTLDDIAHQRFGVRLDGVGGGTGPRDGGATKLIGIAPAAPDAMDDVIAMFEDGASGLDDPSKTPTPVMLNVLVNDTDGDGDPLTITEIHEQPAHGTVAIAADGKTIIYTPELDYAGQVSFEYCVSDGAGGQDHALVTLNIAAVADRPVITATWETTGVVNEVLLHVSADQADADSSEYLTGLVSGGLPAGVTITPVGVATVGEPDHINQDFLLVLPIDQDTAFDLTFTATAQEVSNGDTETATYTVPIIYEYNTTTDQALFVAADQNIWASGNAFTFVDDRFIGVDTGEFSKQIGDTLYAGISGHVQLGLQSTLVFNGGEIDATAGYDLTVDTNYNKTTDVLLIGTAALVTSAHFNTVGPEGSYVLQFLYDVALTAFAGVNIDLGALGSINEGGDIFSIGIGPGSYDLLNIDSTTLGGTFTLPPPLDSLSVDFAWPHIATSEDYPPNPVIADGASNNFLQLNLDLDQMVSQILFGGANPFDPPRIDFGPFFADADILDVDLSAGLNFIQSFSMALGTLSGFLLFEDGSSQAFTFGDDIQLLNASLIDQGGDGDGLVEFTFTLAPDATLNNDTDLGFNVGVSVSLLSVELGYDIEVASDNITLGPLAQFGTVVPVASIGVYDDTFDLAYAQQQFQFAA